MILEVSCCVRALRLYGSSLMPKVRMMLLHKCPAQMCFFYSRYAA